jgi:hypothetical protein
LRRSISEQVPYLHEKTHIYFFGKDRRPLDSAQLATEYYGNIGNVEPDGGQSCQVNSLSNLWPASFIRQTNVSIQTL